MNLLKENMLSLANYVVMDQTRFIIKKVFGGVPELVMAFVNAMETDEDWQENINEFDDETLGKAFVIEKFRSWFVDNAEWKSSNESF